MIKSLFPIQTTYTFHCTNISISQNNNNSSEKNLYKLLQNVGHIKRRYIPVINLPIFLYNRIIRYSKRGITINISVIIVICREKFVSGSGQAYILPDTVFSVVISCYVTYSNCTCLTLLFFDSFLSGQLIRYLIMMLLIPNYVNICIQFIRISDAKIKSKAMNS